MNVNTSRDSSPALKGGDSSLGVVEIATLYESQTERLRVYAEILRTAKSRSRDDFGEDSGSDSESCVDLISARNLAQVAVWRDIRRIAGDGRPVHDPEDH